MYRWSLPQLEMMAVLIEQERSHGQGKEKEKEPVRRLSRRQETEQEAGGWPSE